MIRRLLAAAARGPGVRLDPERVVLGVARGVHPSPKPPVRIFLGTEPAQRRAERVFVWSVERVRDPSRVYEIYFMKELVGFRRLGWLTGFTQYRFAIPDFAGRTGRAIYNDVDQIYLADPAELFDTEMGDHGFLAIDRRDSSVMLMDCARMEPIWNWQAAQRQSKRKLMQAAIDAQLWGPLDANWNARDEEYEPGQSKLLHYTALHTQPWHPFPEQFTYQRSPVAEPWIELERTADAAGYRVFTAAAPSRAFVDAVGRMRPAAADALPSPEKLGEICDLLGGLEATVLDYVGDRAVQPLSLGNGVQVTQRTLATSLADGAVQVYDGVICRDLLEHLPEEDVPWVLDEMFRRAGRFVWAQVSQPADSGRTPESLFADFESAASHHPHLSWKLVVRRRTRLGGEIEFVRDGGLRHKPPTVWIITHGKPGHTIQSVGLATVLGWPYEIKSDLGTALARLRSHFAWASRREEHGLHLVANRALEDWQWPDVIIATGWRPGNIARWLRRESRGRTRIVRIGRKGSQVVSNLDIVVSCAHFGLPPHPRRIETVAPLNQVSPERLSAFRERGLALFGDAPHPRIALLVGGSTVRHRLDEATATRLGREMHQAAENAGGRVFAITSRRTSPEAIRALREELGERGQVHEWKAGEKDNPYLAYLAAADAIVVTGESESMLGEAASSGKLAYIFPLPQREPSLWLRFNDRVLERSRSRRPNWRGTARPQQGFDYLFARLIAWGLLQPPRDLDALHRMLVDLGTARFFEGSIEGGEPTVLRESESVAAKVHHLLGFTDSAALEQPTADTVHPQYSADRDADTDKAIPLPPP